MKFEIVRIDCRVDDSVSPTGVVLNPPKPATKVAVRSTSVLATGSNRLDVAQRALESVAVEQGPSPAAGTLFPRSLGAFGPQGPTLGAFGQPIPVALRQAALQQVD